MTFAFLVHSRTIKDLKDKFKILNYLPDPLTESIARHWRPIVVSKIRYVSPLDESRQIIGYIIGVPMTAKQLLDDRVRGRKRVEQAIEISRSLGATLVGLGALTSPITDGGNDLAGKVACGLTTGNALTAAVAFTHTEKIIEQGGLRKISVIGCTGSIGRALTLMLARRFPDREYFLYARSEASMASLLEEMRGYDPKIKTDHRLCSLELVNETDLVVVATSSSDALVHAGHLKSHAIVYDVTQPQNVDKKTLKDRPDVMVIDGGLVVAPGLNARLPFSLPKDTLFACLGETMLLALDGHQGDFALGKVGLGQVDRILELSARYGIVPAPLHFV